MNFDQMLPVIFLGLMGLAMLVYVILDGFDLGVGMLMRHATPEQADVMIDSIGPFWDANETWLVLGVGILLVAFPKAHGMVLTALYLPVATMLVGLILRGVAFDFRVKARDAHKPLWNTAFIAGSTLAALSQGWMLGHYVIGLVPGWPALLFSAVIAFTLASAYALMGACWLLLKTEGELQLRSARWARRAWAPTVLGFLLISVITPLVSETVRQRWFALPQFIALLPIPLMSSLALVAVRLLLNSSRVRERLCWLPFALLAVVFGLGFLGLAYSLFPYVVMDRLTLWEAASSPAALKVILAGVAITLPAIAGYTIYSYRVFRGKSSALVYGG